MTDAQFLNWIADRFINVLGESPSVDFVVRLRSIADEMNDNNDGWASELRDA